MPWDTTTLMVAELRAGVARAARAVLSRPDVAVAQAEWEGPGSLLAMADHEGWWNLHRVLLEGSEATVECVLAMAEECADALWRIGATWFASTSAGVVLRHGVGSQQLALWDPASRRLTPLAEGWTEFGGYLGGTGPTTRRRPWQ